MKRWWWLLLALSVGLNIGLAVATLRDHRPALATQPGVGPGAGGPAGVPGGPPFPGGPGSPGPGGPDESARGEEQERMSRRLAAIAAQVGIAPQTVEKMVAVRKQGWAEITAQRAAVRQERQALQQAFASTSLDPGQVRACLRRLALAQGRVDSLVTETMLRELTLLTPAERQAYLNAMPWGRGGAGPGEGRLGRHGPRGRAATGAQSR